MNTKLCIPFINTNNYQREYFTNMKLFPMGTSSKAPSEDSGPLRTAWDMAKIIRYSLGQFGRTKY